MAYLLRQILIQGQVRGPLRCGLVCSRHESESDTAIEADAAGRPAAGPDPLPRPPNQDPSTLAVPGAGKVLKSDPDQVATVTGQQLAMAEPLPSFQDAPNPCEHTSLST